MQETNRKSRALDDEDLEGVSGGVGDVTLTGSGSFMSNTGTSLNLVVNWYAGVDNFGNRGLMVVVSASSGNLMAGAIANSIAVVYHTMGDYENSRRWFQKAANIILQVYGDCGLYRSILESAEMVKRKMGK